MAADSLILVDNLPSYRRTALVRGGELDQIWFDDGDDDMPPLGTVLAVRILQVFPDHDRVTVSLPQSKAASLRIKGGGNYQAGHAGQMIAASIAAESRAGKPPQLSFIGDIAPRDLPANPAILKMGSDGLASAQKAAPDAAIIHDDDGQLWAEYDIDGMLDAAYQSVIELPEGSLHIATPPGAAVVDIDGTAAPFVLSKMAIAPMLRQLRLRRAAGPIVIDFPRLTPDQQNQIHSLMKDACKGEKAALHGFTKGGLYTMSRVWRWRPLAECGVGHDRFWGLAALRHIRNHGAMRRQGAPRLRLEPSVLAWLESAKGSAKGYGGAEALKELTKPLAFLPQLVSDSTITGVQLDQ